MKLSPKIILVLIFITHCLFWVITLVKPITVYGQSNIKTGLPLETGRDPFGLPPGIRLLSQSETTSITKEANSSSEMKTREIPLPPLKVNAILISDRIQLASIDQHIVTVGDSIHDERILEIRNDRVILGKGGKKRTLLLSQSPIQFTVEEK